MSISAYSWSSYFGARFVAAQSARFWLFFALIMGVLTIGSAKAITPLKIDADSLPDDCHITHWSLLGPFAFIPQENQGSPIGTVHHDFLSDIGFPEEKLDLAGLKALSRSHEIYKTYSATSALLKLEDIYPNNNNILVYAVAEIRSKKDTEIGIEVSSQDGLTLWMNGQPVLSTQAWIVRPARAYDQIGVAHLHRGANILIAKVDRKSDGWNLLLNFIGAAPARAMIRDQSSGGIVYPHLLHAGEPLQIYLPSECVQSSIAVEVRNSGGNTVYSQNISDADLTVITLPAWLEGYYSLPVHRLAAITLPVEAEDYYSLTVNSLCGPIDDSFYTGDPATVYRNVVSLRNTKAPTSSEYLSLDALAQRYEILNAPAYSRPSERNWQRKMLMVLKDGNRSIKDPDSQQWSSEPGLHLREYISSVDGTHKHYLICIPTSYKAPAALIMMPPPKQETARPFLESALLTSMDDLDRMKQGANENHVLVVKLGDRGNLFDAPMSEKEFFDVLWDVERNYDIDSKRVYLFGHSESGRRSLLLAEHYPSIFAGVGTYGALTAAYQGDDLHARWAQENNVTSLMRNLDNIPTIIVYGDRDSVNSTESTKALYQTMVENSVPASFHTLRYGLHNQPYTERLIVPLLLSQTAPPSTHIDYTFPSLNRPMDDWIQIKSREDRRLVMKLKADTHGSDITIQSSNINSLCINFGRLQFTMGQAVNVNWNSHAMTVHAETGCSPLQIGTPMKSGGINSLSDGTLAEALSEPFLVVVGTGMGESAELEAKKNAFASMWKHDFFEAPRIKSDTDLTSDDIGKYNLVLIGQPANDSRLAAANVLIKLVDSEVFLSQESQHPGAGFQEAFVLPNPLNVNRSLIFLNLSPDLLNSPHFDPALTGYYDYALWDETGQMLKSGIFDENEYDRLSTSLPVSAPVANQLVP